MLLQIHMATEGYWLYPGNEAVNYMALAAGTDTKLSHGPLDAVRKVMDTDIDQCLLPEKNEANWCMCYRVTPEARITP